MDTEIDDTKTAAETPAATAPRRSSKIDLAAATATVEGVVYRADDMPRPAMVWCTLNGIRRHLLSAKSPADAWAALVAGDLPSDRAAKPKELDPWRKAYALAWTDKQAKDRGIKLKTPEYADLLSEGKAHGAGIGRQELTRAKLITAVVTHFNRITGNEAAL